MTVHPSRLLIAYCDSKKIQTHQKKCHLLVKSRQKKCCFGKKTRQKKCNADVYVAVNQDIGCIGAKMTYF